MNTKRFITLTLGTALAVLPIYVHAQQDQQDQNVVEAARKAQADKKNAPKAKMTIDDDNLNTLTGTVSVVGEAPAPASDADQTKPLATDKKSAVKDEAYWRKAFAEANKKLADDEHELDILQREYNLKQQQFYQDPMASLKQEYSRQDLNDTKQKIDDKTAAVANDKQDISNLEDALRQSGGDPGWANSPATPASDQSAPAPAAPASPSPATQNQ